MRWLSLLFFVLPSISQANSACVKVSDIASTSDTPSALVQVYEKAVVGLERFPSLLAVLEEQSPVLCLSDKMDDAHGYFDIDKNEIHISEKLSKDMKIGVLLHEIRHLEQFSRGICPSDTLAMQEYARATFALEADASAISLLVAWGMKESGNSGSWAALATWPTQSDIASAFASEMLATSDTSSAVSAAFDQWYQSDARREDYYIASCSGFLDRQDSSKALPLYQLVSVSFLSELCRMPNGSLYECSLRTIEHD